MTGKKLMIDAFEEQLDRNGMSGIDLFMQASRDEDDTFSGVANQLSISRSSIRVSIEGIDLSHYNRNPVVLASHEQVNALGHPLAIGTVSEMKKVRSENSDLRDGLVFKGMRFDTDEISQIWKRKVQLGIVKMTSIGFIPLRYDYDEVEVGRGEKKRAVGFIDIQESELIELSVVVIGANRFAFINPQKQKSQERISDLESQVAELSAAVEKLRGAISTSKLDEAMKRLLSAAA